MEIEQYLPVGGIPLNDVVLLRSIIMLRCLIFILLLLLFHPIIITIIITLVDVIKCMYFNVFHITHYFAKTLNSIARAQTYIYMLIIQPVKTLRRQMRPDLTKYISLLYVCYTILSLSFPVTLIP